MNTYDESIKAADAYTPGGDAPRMTGLPTRADVEALFDADRPGRRAWWCAVWVPPLARWRLVYDPPSPPRPEVGRHR